MRHDVMERTIIIGDVHGCIKELDALLEKYSFYNLNELVLLTTTIDEDEILDELLEQTDGEAILLEDVTQCGVGVESDKEGNLYITVLLAKADS